MGGGVSSGIHVEGKERGQPVKTGSGRPAPTRSRQACVTCGRRCWGWIIEGDPTPTIEGSKHRNVE
jgi:hypothetical protein